MKVEVNIDKNCKETKIVIHTQDINDKIIKLIENLQNKEMEELKWRKNICVEKIFKENKRIFRNLGGNYYEKNII